MQLGFVSAILPELSLEEVLSIAKRLDYECVEVMCWPVGKADRRYAGVTHLDVETLDDAAIQRVQALVESTGVFLSGLGYYPNPLTPDEVEAQRSRSHLKKLIDAAAKLGLSQVNTFIGRDWKKSVAENWPLFLEVWRPLIAHAESRNVRIGIENCPMLFSADEWPGGKNLASTPAVWRKMFAEIPSDHFGLNYDPSHLVWQHMDCCQPMREFASKLFHIHAKDVKVHRDRLNDVGTLALPLEYHSPKLPGLGDVPWGEFFSTLTDCRYRGPVCVEVEDRAYEESLDSRLAALRQTATYLRQYLPRRESLR